MRLASLILGVLLLGFCTASVMAAPGGGLDEKPWSYPHATTSIVPEQEPNDACPGQTIACGDVVSPASFSVATDDDWYAFDVASAGTLITVGTQGYQGSDIDTYLELYDVCGGTYIAYDDDGGPNMFSLISNFAAPHAGMYYARAYSYGHYYTGSYELFVSCVGGSEPPENDMCDGAIAIERCTNGVLTGDSFSATNNYDPSIPGPSCTGYSAAGKDVVYKVTAESGDVLHLDYVQPSADAAFYVVTDCANVSGTCVAGADATVTGGHEVISYTVTAAGTYYIILDSYTSAYGGPWTLTYEAICPGPIGVCCVGQTCMLIHEFECDDYGGVWHPEWTSCTDNPCHVITPADPSSWGQIKNAYR